MQSAFDILFANGSVARVIRVEHDAALAVALHALGLTRPMPVLVLVGGAGSMIEADLARLRPLFVEGLAPVVEQVGAAVVDGGTAAGVMRLMGEARQKIGATFPLIGVAATGTVALPGATDVAPDAATLDDRHTHFVLVPGSTWGDEARWIADVASALAAGSPSLTVLVGGGNIAYDDVEQSVRAARPVLVVTGTGGTADALAAALSQKRPPSRVRRVVVSGLLQAVTFDDGDVAAWSTLISEHVKEFKDDREKRV